MKFTLNQPNYDKSPYTGMTRKHWIEVAEYMMEGVFAHVPTLEAPIELPRHETAISYPQPQDKEWRFQAARFENLARTFLVAAPLLVAKPEATAAGYSLRDYYATQIVAAMNPASQSFVGTIEGCQAVEGDIFPFQQTVECAALAYGLWATKPLIWDRYTKDERDAIARFLSGFGHARTSPHNWRYFNILMLVFLKTEGYTIDEALLLDHLHNIMAYDVGDGWYRDGRFFDYYSPWTFQVSGAIFNQMYGYEHEPEIAMAIEQNFNQLMKNYPSFFDKNGHMIMWGRSNVYRFNATSPFPANFLLKEPAIDPGYARRLLSGNALQFLTQEDFLYKGVPCLGFYGPFDPMVQSYSCAGSPFWLGYAFIGLLLPEDHPFWNAPEHNGAWEELAGAVQTHEGADCTQQMLMAHSASPTDTCTCTGTSSTLIPGAGIEAVQYGATGSSEIRTSKVLAPVNHPWLAEYSRLAFHSAFPWEKVDTKTGINPMQYALRQGAAEIATQTDTASDGSSTSASTDDTEASPYHLPDAIGFAGKDGHVLYRRILWNFHTEHRKVIDTADITMPKGVLRIDRVRMVDTPYSLTLSHYGLPHPQGDCTVTTLRGSGGGNSAEHGVTLPQLPQDSQHLKPVPFTAPPHVPTSQSLSQDGNAIQPQALLAETKTHQLAMVTYCGLDTLQAVERSGMSAVTQQSTVLYGTHHRTKRYGGMEFIITLMLHNTEGCKQNTKHAKNVPFTQEDLNPIAHIEFFPIYPAEHPKAGRMMGVSVSLHDGRTILADFAEVEGKLQY